MKIIHLFLIFVLISCSGQRDKKNIEISENTPVEQQTSENENETATVELLGNGLMSKMKGDWLTAILPDSIQRTREILQWKNAFYGDLLISINDNDTLAISGNMDQGRLKYHIIDSVTIMLPGSYKLFITEPT